VLPGEREMTDWIDADREAMQKRYVASDRHTMQVDYWRYIRAMKEARMRKPTPSLRDRVLAPLAGLR
jgi:hypothetical protein